MSKPRFSRAALGEYITKRILYLEGHHGFDRNNGYAQVKGKGEELNRLYGEYSTLRDLVQEFELALPRQDPTTLIGGRVRA